MDTTLFPYSIFLFLKGGGGDRVLFRYPYNVMPKKRQTLSEANGKVTASTSNLNRNAADERVTGFRHKRTNPYSLPPVTDGLFLPEDSTSSKQNSEALQVDNLPTFQSKVLANLFCVSSKLCDEKFELKINDVRFVGHPVSLEVKPEEEMFLARKPTSTMTMFHVVFALKANTDYSVVECFHDLSQKIGVAIKYEERRCGYLADEYKIMSNAQEEMASRPEDRQTSPFGLALERSQLAQDLKQIYEDMCHSGIVYVRINKYIEVSFCMPQKVFKRLHPHLTVEPEAIFSCLEALRPYHGMLLLYEERELLDQFPLDASPALKKLIRQAAPMKSFRTLARDADISLRQVFHLAGHLLYWGKASIIYPICESNVYVISPKISNLLSRVVQERFSDKFPGESLIEMLSIFSLPTSISQRSAPTFQMAQLQLLTRVIVWFLQQHLLVQLHTYVSLALNKDMKFNLEDPLEKRFKKPSALNERLNGMLENSTTESKPIPKDLSESLQMDDLINGTNDSSDYAGMLLMNDSILGSEVFQSSTSSLPPPQAISSLTSSSAKGLETLKEGEVHNGLSSSIVVNINNNNNNNNKNVVTNGLTNGTAESKESSKEKLSPQEQLLVEFNAEEKENLLRVPATSNLEDLKLFVKVCRYFNGKYHLEEIMYHENMRRSQLLQVIDKFRSVLVRHEHEDPAVTMYFRNN